jgi:hemoglobin-like flavoprotein
MITTAQIQLVRSSFEQLLPIADVVGELLYGRIFRLAPETRALFGDDISPQAKRIMAAVKDVVDGLDRLEDLRPFLVRLGARHVRYGVEPRHFEIGGVALVWTLESGLGEAFTPAVREAWLEVWNFIVEGMVAGMRQAQRAADAAAA